MLTKSFLIVIAILLIISSITIGDAQNVNTPINKGDINGDGEINILDLNIIKKNFGETNTSTNFDARADINNDGIIDIYDLTLVSKEFGTIYYLNTDEITDEIENYSIEVKPPLLDARITDFQLGDYSSKIKIQIQINESGVMNSLGKIPNLNLIYNGLNKTLEYDNKKHQYFIDDDIILSGDPRLYPFDKYSSEISIVGWELTEGNNNSDLLESGFEFEEIRKKDKILITLSRDILMRYSISIIVLIIIGFIIYSHLNNLNHTQMTDKKILELVVFIFSISLTDLYFAFHNLNYVTSIGFLPFLFFVISLIYKTYMIKNHHNGKF